MSLLYRSYKCYADGGGELEGVFLNPTAPLDVPVREHVRFFLKQGVLGLWVF
jgi:hypothetical protein